MENEISRDGAGPGRPVPDSLRSSSEPERVHRDLCELRDYLKTQPVDWQGRTLLVRTRQILDRLGPTPTAARSDAPEASSPEGSKSDPSPSSLPASPSPVPPQASTGREWRVTRIPLASSIPGVDPGCRYAVEGPTLQPNCPVRMVEAAAPSLPAMDLEALVPGLLELARSEPHDDDDCPNDDTCRCANIAKLNAEFKAIEKLAPAPGALPLPRPMGDDPLGGAGDKRDLNPLGKTLGGAARRVEP